MTKRYVINDNMIEDTQSDDYYHFNDWRDFRGLCKLANDLYADNKPLQDEMKRMSKDFKKALNEVVKEHNNLLEKNKQLKTDLKQQKILINSLKDQNQKLKLRLKDLGVEY